MILALDSLCLTATVTRLPHPLLREFCGLLYQSRNLLEEQANSQLWREFAGELWEFHSRAIHTPFSLSRVAPAGEVQTRLEGAHRRAARNGALTSHCDALMTALDGCRKCNLAPIGDELESILTESEDVRAVLLPVHNPQLEEDLAAALAGKAVEVVAPPSQHTPSFRLGLSAVVIGKLRGLEPTLLRAALGNMAFRVIQYDWVQDASLMELSGPTLAELESGTPSCSFAKLHTQVSPAKFSWPTSEAAGATQLEETIPYPRENSWDDFASGVNFSSDDDTDILEERGDRVSAVAIGLCGEGSELWAVLHRADSRLTYIRADSTASLLREGGPMDLEPGDWVVQFDPPQDQRSIASVAHADLRKRGVETKSMDQQGRWKRLLRKKVQAVGEVEVARQIALYCQDWKPGPDRIREWIREETLGPQQKQAFRAVCRYLNIEHEVPKLWAAYQLIKNAHINAGRSLKERLKAELKSYLAVAELKSRSALALALSGRRVMLYPVARVGVRPQQVHHDHTSRLIRVTSTQLDDVVARES